MIFYILTAIVSICVLFGTASLYSYFFNKPSVVLIGVQVMVGQIGASVRDLCLRVLIALGFTVYPKPSLLVFSKEMMVTMISKRERQRTKKSQEEDESGHSLFEGLDLAAMQLTVKPIQSRGLCSNLIMLTMQKFTTMLIMQWMPRWKQLMQASHHCTRNNDWTALRRASFNPR